MSRNIKQLFGNTTRLDFSDGCIRNRKTGEVIDLPENPVGFLQIKQNEYLAVCGINVYTIVTTRRELIVKEIEATVVGEYASSGKGAWCSHNNSVIVFHENTRRFSLTLVHDETVVSLGELKSCKGRHRVSDSALGPQTGEIKCPLLNPKLLFVRGACIRDYIRAYMQGTASDGSEVLFSVILFDSWESGPSVGYCWYEDEIGSQRHINLEYISGDAEPIGGEPPSKCSEIVNVEYLSSPAKSARK